MFTKSLLQRVEGYVGRINCNFYLKMCTENNSNWRGVPLSDIYGSHSPWDAPEFPPVVPGYNHTVLYHIPSNGELPADRPPKPQIGHDKWDHDHVRMPCSSHSLYPYKDNNGEVHLRKRWEIIVNALSKPIRNVEELADAILSYNTKFKDIWKFRALKKLFNEYLEEEESQYFFDVTLPEIAKLTLALPKLIQAPIPLLKQNKNHSISLTQQQISSLLANAFFCTFPRRNTTKKTSEYAKYPFINFIQLYENSGSDHILEKMKCLCHYFKRVCTKVPVGVLTFSRRCVAHNELPSWPTCDVTMSSIPLHVDPEHTIEDADGLIQVDFANKYLGGGVLNYGCVQEEIRFVICPELMVSMLFTEVLRYNEVLMMIGSERYSRYAGYGRSMSWRGAHCDVTPVDASRRRRSAVLALDAAPVTCAREEYRRDVVNRELNKAWIGFSFGTDNSGEWLRFPGVATGNWGCGAFGGTPQLKSLLQLMAAANARRPLAYYTFNDLQIRDDLIRIYNLLVSCNVTVGQLYKYIVKYPQVDDHCSDLLGYLHRVITEQTQHTVHKQEPMDTSTTSDTPVNELSSSIQKEFEQSPDLFSQDTDDSLVEIKIENKITDTTNVQTDGQDQTSRLFNEMEKIDEQSGRLNLSAPQTSPFKESNTSVTSVNDPKVELKKTISKKITDYFSKKT